MNLSMLKTQLDLSDKRLKRLKDTREYKSKLAIAQVHIDAIDRMIEREQAVNDNLKRQIDEIEHPNGKLQDILPKD